MPNDCSPSIRYGQRTLCNLPQPFSGVKDSQRDRALWRSIDTCVTRAIEKASPCFLIRSESRPPSIEWLLELSAWT